MIASDCDRLSSRSASAGTAPARLTPVVLLQMLPAILHQVHRNRLVFEVLQIQRDAYPVGGRAAEVGIKLGA